MTTEPQENSRTVSAGTKVTASEKADLRIVAAVDQTTEADLLRDFTLSDVITRANEIRVQMDAVRAGAA